MEDSGEGGKVVHVARLKPCYLIATEMEELRKKRLLDIFNEESDHEEF